MNRQVAVLVARLKADKKKAAMLGVLSLVLVVLGAKNGLRAGPSRGLAASSPAQPESAIAAAGTEAMTRTMASLDARAGRRVVEVPASPSLGRDLFRLDPAHFPVPTQPGQTDPSADGSGRSGVESPPPNADELRRRREAELVSETAQWRLRSVLLGHHPTAVIEPDAREGRRLVLRTGDEVRGWRVVEIAAGHAVLEKESVRVRLSLPIPER
jgi:hypothetical protein